MIRKTNGTMGFIASGLEIRSSYILLQMYRGRPLLEYCVQLCFSNLRKDKQVLEAVEKSFTRLISGMRRLSYQSNKRDIYFLEFRRMNIF